MSEKMITNPVLEIPEGYSIGTVHEHYGTFDVFYGERKIGRVSWHGYYYSIVYAGKEDFNISGSIRAENPQQRCLNMIIAFHRMVGDITTKYGVGFYPNVTMTTFAMASWYITPVLENIHLANVHRKADGWHVEQLYGALEITVYQTAQEAIDAATAAAKEKGDTVTRIDIEMVKAGWAKDRSDAKKMVGGRWDWGHNPVYMNGKEYDSISLERKVLPGDVITWKGKTWTVQ